MRTARWLSGACFVIGCVAASDLEMVSGKWRTETRRPRRHGPRAVSLTMQACLKHHERGAAGGQDRCSCRARASCPTTADIVLLCNKPASVERSCSARAVAPIHFRRASPRANRIILSFETHADRPRTPTFSHEARSGFRRSTSGPSGCARDARPRFHTNPLPFQHNNKGARQDTAA